MIPEVRACTTLSGATARSDRSRERRGPAGLVDLERGGRLRDGLLAVEAFSSLLEARVLVEDWRIEYNTLRPTAP
jgi:hypothetical protein